MLICRKIVQKQSSRSMLLLSMLSVKETVYDVFSFSFFQLFIFSAFHFFSLFYRVLSDTAHALIANLEIGQAGVGSTSVLGGLSTGVFCAGIPVVYSWWSLTCNAR